MTEIDMNEKRKKTRCLHLWGRFHQLLTPAALVISGVSRQKGENQKEKQNKKVKGHFSRQLLSLGGLSTVCPAGRDIMT